MTFAQLKASVARKLKGDRDVSGFTTDDWLDYIDRAFSDIIAESIPVKLMNGYGDTEKSIYGIDVRSWDLPSADTDAIDLDEPLCKALADRVAADIAVNEQNIMKYSSYYAKAIDNHNWNVYSRMDGHNGEEDL